MQRRGINSETLPITDIRRRWEGKRTTNSKCLTNMTPATNTKPYITPTERDRHTPTNLQVSDPNPMQGLDPEERKLAMEDHMDMQPTYSEHAFLRTDPRGGAPHIILI